MGQVERQTKKKMNHDDEHLAGVIVDHVHQKDISTWKLGCSGILRSFLNRPISRPIYTRYTQTHTHTQNETRVECCIGIYTRYTQNETRVECCIGI